jgi:CCR4-NOT transcription complex subunit 1
MEVFTKSFRRLLQQNAQQVFPTGARSTEPNGSYQHLVDEMQKLRTHVEQAGKIAESIDSTEGDLYRDFDLLTFMTHFQLDPIAKTLLALACRSATKADLQTKGRYFIPFYTLVYNIDFEQPMRFCQVSAKNY